nr:methionine--trna ligase, chloroplastic/mitochondrial [Quercus suber]
MAEKKGGYWPSRSLRQYLSCLSSGLPSSPAERKLLRKNVVFISRTDENGEKIASAAAARGSDPSEHCDLDISYDKFVWTTDPKHEAIVKEFSSRVLVNGASSMISFLLRA